MSQASPIVATLTLKKGAKPLTAFGSEMRKPTPPPINIVEANAKLRAWRKKYNTPEKVAALHRKAVNGLAPFFNVRVATIGDA